MRPFDIDETTFMSGLVRSLAQRAIVVTIPEFDVRTFYEALVPARDRDLCEEARRLFGCNTLPSVARIRSVRGPTISLVFEASRFAVPSRYHDNPLDMTEGAFPKKFPELCAWINDADRLARVATHWAYASTFLNRSCDGTNEFVAALPSVSALMDVCDTPLPEGVLKLRENSHSFKGLATEAKTRIKIHQAKNRPVKHPKGWGRTLFDIDRDAATLIAQSLMIRDAKTEMPDGLSYVSVDLYSTDIPNPFDV